MKHHKNLLPRYADDTDYNTNAPSYYEALARFIKPLKELTNRVNDVEQRFKDLVIEWLEDGTLAGLLEQVLLDDYPTKEDLKKSIDDLNINDYAKIDWINQIINEINLQLDQVENTLNNLVEFKNKTEKKLNHFIININEFTGTDTEKIKKALLKARDLNGGIVYVPTGTYVLTDELVIYENTTLLCEQGVKFDRNHSGYMFMNGERGENYRQYDGHGNIKIINGTFDGKAQNNLSGKATLIALAHADGILIDNVTVTNANSHHIEINSSKNVTIRNSKILGQLSSMEFVEGIQLDLATKNGFSAFGEHDNTPCKDVHIHNCYFGESKELPSLARGIGTHATRIGAFMENVLIENNVFHKMRDFGIQFLCYKNSTVRNNEFYNCNGGIICYSSNPDNENHILDIYNHVTSTVQPCTNITIESNWFNRISGKQIIYCYGREKSKNNNFKIIDNKIDNSLDVRGVIVSKNSNHIEINNNIIDNVGNFPISVRDGSWVTINNNDITNSLTHTAIRAVEKIRYLHITNNKIFKTGGNAINVFNDVFSIVITGNICLGANGLDEDYHSIYVHTDGGSIITSNNVIRKLTDFVYGSAIYITNTVKDGIMSNNVADKGTSENKYVASELTNVNNV